MLIWTEERKRVKQMERESLAWAVACAVAQTGPRVQPPAVVQRSANPRPAAAALPPGRFRARLSRAARWYTLGSSKIFLLVL